MRSGRVDCPSMRISHFLKLCAVLDSCKRNRDKGLLEPSFSESTVATSLLRIASEKRLLHLWLLCSSPSKAGQF